MLTEGFAFCPLTILTLGSLSASLASQHHLPECSNLFCCALPFQRQTQPLLHSPKQAAPRLVFLSALHERALGGKVGCRVVRVTQKGSPARNRRLFHVRKPEFLQKRPSHRTLSHGLSPWSLLCSHVAGVLLSSSQKFFLPLLLCPASKLIS